MASSTTTSPAPDGITIRQMRLKVLYTFDSESKTTCLARWPHLLDIQTAYLDQDTQIGVIELRTCIQAIVSASPELVARISNDYTIYAYDYSEYETPLVGQGMLSWILAAASTTPDAPAHQSKTIVTGRVCKNVGPFSRGAQETLEVRLKLVPVPIALQSEYNSSMARYRETAGALCTDLAIERWAGFVQNTRTHANGGHPQSDSLLQLRRQEEREDEYSTDDMADYFRCRERCSSPSARSGIEHFQALLSECAAPTTRDISNMAHVGDGSRVGSPPLSVAAAMTPRLRPSSPAVSIGRPASRTQVRQQSFALTTPSHSDQTTTLQQQQPTSRRRGSRPTSRSNSVSRRSSRFAQPVPAAPELLNTAPPGNSTSGYDSSDEAPFETSAPKRAKLMRPTRPNLNIERQQRTSTSLLKAASNAASVRIHRPRARNPQMPGMESQVLTTGGGEEQVRPPTPVPEGPLKPQNRLGSNGPGRLRRQSSLATSAISMRKAAETGRDSASPSVSADDGAGASSSEDYRETSGPRETPPLNIPSSPPIFGTACPQTSSPGLPPPPDYDSGFMSGGGEAPLMSDDCSSATVRPSSKCAPSEQVQHQQAQPAPSNDRITATTSRRPSTARSTQPRKFTPILPPAPLPSVPSSNTGSSVRTTPVTATGTSNAAQQSPALLCAAPVTTVAAAAPQPQAHQQDQAQQVLSRPQSQQSQSPLLRQPPPTHLPATGETSRPSSRASVRANRLLAPAPAPGSTTIRTQSWQSAAGPATDPAAPATTLDAATPESAPQQYDYPVKVPATSLAEASRIKSTAKRARLPKVKPTQPSKEPSMPPYCQNCGAVETPTWRRAWFRVVEGDEKAARELSRKEPGTCFWEPLNQDGEGTMTSFKQFKKTLSSSDKSFTQLCLCNPCGLYLYKMEKMRPENMWNKSAQKAKRKKGKARLAPVPPPGPLLTGRPLLPHLPPPLAPLTDPRPSTDAAGNDGSGLELMPVSVKLSGSSPATSPTRMPANDKLQTDGCMMAATSPDVNDCPEDVTTQGRASTAALSSPGGAAQVKATIVIGEDGGATIQTSPTLSHPFAATFASTRAATTVLPSIEGNDEAEQSASLSVSQSRQAQKRATSEQPPGSAEKRRRMNTDAAIEALKKAIQASPARRLAGSGNKSIPNATAATDLDLQELTPKPVCRKLFPSAAAKSQTPQLAATATSSSRTVNGGAVQSSPVKRLTNRNEMTIGNATATRNHGASAIESPTVGALDAQIIDDIFNSQTTAALDLAIPMTPSKQQQHHQFSVPSHSNGQPSARTSPSKGLAQSKNGLVPSVCNEPSPSSPRTRTAIEATTSASPGSAHHIQPGAGSGMAIQPPATLPMSQPENALATPIDIDSFISQIAPYPAASPVGAGGPPLFPDWDTWVDAMATTAVDGSTRPTDFLAAPTDYLSQATTTGQAQALDDLLGSLPPAAPPDDQSATLFDFFMTMTPPGEEAGASTDLQPTAQHQQSQLTGIKPGDAGVQQASGAATPGTQLCTEAPELAVAPAMLALAPPVTASTGSAAHAAT